MLGKEGRLIMPKVSVDINPSVISWALSQSDISQLGNKLMDNITKWINGTKSPTFNQMEDFSKKSNIPLGYFFLDTPPEEKIGLLDFRTIDNLKHLNPSRNLIDTIYEMERIQDWMREYRIDSGFDELPLVGSLSKNESVDAVANKIRLDLDLSINWYSNCKDARESFTFIRKRLEECGIIVMMNGIVGKNTHRILDVEEFRAFTMINAYAPLIFINGVDSQGARLFSLFHEIVHIWLGENDFYNANSVDDKSLKRTEIICNAVANELIVPKKEFLVMWDLDKGHGNVFNKILNLSIDFRCSKMVIARKALDNNKIDLDVYNQIKNDSIDYFAKRKENKTSGGNYYNTMGTRLDGCLVRALCESILTGRTTYTEAYRLTNTNAKTFNEIANRLGGVL